MGILGIIFGQSKTVIGAADGSGAGGFGRLQGVVRSAFGGIGGIVVDATVSEEPYDSCEITKNPVEDGETVTDHAQVMPTRLAIEGVISDSPLGFAIIGNVQNVVRTAATLFGRSSRSIDAYNQLLKLMRDRQPFTVITGLRQYKNMLLTELAPQRNKDTGAALHFRATMEEVRIVSSKTTPGSPAASVGSLASPTKDFGQQVTDPVPAFDPLSQDATGITQPGSVLNRWFGKGEELQ